MNKEQQIEEMANIIKAEYWQWLDTTGVIPKGTIYYADCFRCAIDSAEALYNEGYLKGETISCQVTVDSSLLDYINQLEDRLVEIRNEMAEEILDELLKEENLENVYFTDKNGDIRDRQVIRIEKIKDLAKKYCVEVEE